VRKDCTSIAITIASRTASKFWIAACAHSDGSRRDAPHVLAATREKSGGYCGYGCTLGAKQSSTKTWLADAQQHGARFVVETRAVRVRIEAGSATGVEARSRKATV